MYDLQTISSCLEATLGRPTAESSHVDMSLPSNTSRDSRDIFNPLTAVLLKDLEGIVDLSHLNVASSGNVEALNTIAVASFFVEVVDDVLDLVYSFLSSVHTASEKSRSKSTPPTFVCTTLQRSDKRLIREHPDEESIAHVPRRPRDPACSMAR